MNVLSFLHFPGAGRLGLGAFVPGLGLLANQDYAQKLAHFILPHVPDVLVPLLGGFIVGLAGLMLLYAKSPAAQVFIPNNAVVTSTTEVVASAETP